MTRKILLFLFILATSSPIFSQIEDPQNLQSSKSINTQSSNTSYSGNFFVGGDENTYYPIGFHDKGWNYHESTILKLGRSDVHYNYQWHGALIATFECHISRWGHGANFINADIKQNNPSKKNFIGGWQDATATSNGVLFIIWLRGNTTYFYSSNYPQEPIITNGVLTFEGKTYATKTNVDKYVNENGTTLARSLWAPYNYSNYFEGNVGIGISKPTYKLDVNGTIRAKEVKVETGWADFVFDKDYKLPTLKEVESHIEEYKRLPDIPSEDQVKEEGVNLAEMQVKLLQKIEELTLYVIQQEKKNQELEKKIEELQTTLSSK